jgi:uncharacterized protein (DUF2461 family)
LLKSIKIPANSIIWKPPERSVNPANDLEKYARQILARGQRGYDFMSNKAVLENVRRYRAIASLFRQTAAFRPSRRESLVTEAQRWEHLALSELEAYVSTCVDQRIEASAA